MTDNSAEREAERVLRDASREIQAERCPQGEECAVHHRVDEEYVLESVQYARFITYAGDYCVVTSDNHVYESPTFLLKLALGLVSKADLPDRWETMVFHVGSGALGDLEWLSAEGRAGALRYVGTHDDWDNLHQQHDFVVIGINSDTLDVSKPAKLED